MATSVSERSVTQSTQEVQLSPQGVSALGKGALGTTLIERDPMYQELIEPEREVQPAPRPDSVADICAIPLAELPALSLTLLYRTIGRTLADSSAPQVPVEAFQSAL